ncbi:HCP-like protein [Rhizophagus irregularis]|uniref:HCP-like protein n=1 Tax=Rhizophagus irregularis TaxID=588596 RepID=A0A2I1H854_9GLOM|nr:HCP-like protein [Rhizophagus irregularis]
MLEAVIHITTTYSKYIIHISTTYSKYIVPYINNKALEGSLKKYWSVSSDVGLLATLLDPRSKKLVRFNTTEVQKATTLLVKRYEMFMENEVNIEDKNEGENDEDKGEEDNDNNKNLDDFNLDKSLMDSIFGEEEVCEEENEVDVYLKLKPVRNINPLSWWKSNEDKFPILSKLSKEFFGISATSVPSERLFSDVGNLITNKRSSLKSEKTSSGHKPFREVNHGLSLMLSILNGEREEIIDGTPIGYSNLYTECWRFEPNKRPDVQEVVSKLRATVSSEVTINLNEDNKSTYSPEENESMSKLSKGTADINDALNNNNSLINIISNISNIDHLELNNCSSGTFERSSISSISYDINESEIELHNHLDIMEFKDTSSIVSDKMLESSTDLIESISCNANKIIADELIGYINEKHDRGIAFDQVRQLINNIVLKLKSNQSINNLIYWLSTNQDNSKYGWLLGLFYYYDVGIKEKEKKSTKSFELFSKAVGDNYLIAKVYLAKCYYDGYGTMKNKLLAFAEKEYINVQCNLGILYENGEGTGKDLNQAFYWYSKAAENGCKIAQYNLGRFYQGGKGVEKDKYKVFEYYKKSAEQKYLNAEFMLGYCYDKGIGTEINKLEAFKLYKIAAKKGLDDAQNSLAALYIRSKKNLKKAIYWFQKAAENGNALAYDNLGITYELGICNDKNEFKAFELYKKLAEKGYINAMFHLGYCYVNGIGTEVNKELGNNLYCEAAEKGNGYIVDVLKLLYKNEEEIVKDIKEVKCLYQKAVENDNKVALYKLGECYEVGKGVSKNEARALDFYKQATRKGYVVDIEKYIKKEIIVMQKI